MPALLQRYLSGALFLVGVAYVVNVGLLGFLLSPFDYDHLSAYYEIAWRFWRHDPGLPAYNPFLCGGRSLGGDPQIPIFHPLIWLVPLIGATWLIKLEMLLQLGIGLQGLRRLLRHLGTSLLGERWGLLLFIAGGGVIARFLVGHVTLGFYFLLPALLAFSYDLSSSPWSKRTLLYYLAVYAYAGLYKPNFFIYLVPVLALEVLTRAVVGKNPRPLLAFLLAVFFLVSANAVSYLPAHFYFQHFPRHDPHLIKFIPFQVALLNLLLPLKAIPNDWYGPLFLQRHEYNQFLGPVALFFSWSGLRLLRLKHRPEALGLVTLLVASLWIGCGAPDSVTWAWPSTWLSSIWPGFASVRVPTRLWFGASLALLIFSARGFPAQLTALKKWVILLLGVLPLVITAVINLSKVSVGSHGLQWGVPSDYQTQFSWVTSSADRPYLTIRAGHSALECLHNMEVFRSPQIREGDLLMGLDPESQLVAVWDGWSRIYLEGSVNRSELIYFNFNFSPYWTFSGEGGHLSGALGTPLVLVPTSTEVLGTLTFTQPGVGWGAVLSAIAWLLFMVLAIWGRAALR